MLEVDVPEVVALGVPEVVVLEVPVLVELGAPDAVELGVPEVVELDVPEVVVLEVPVELEALLGLLELDMLFRLVLSTRTREDNESPERCP
jgi:hypothetical protein